MFKKKKEVTARITKRVKNRLSKSKLVQKISRNPRKTLVAITVTGGIICVVCYKVSKSKSIPSLVTIAILKLRGGGESTTQLEHSRVQMDASAIPNTGLVKADALINYRLAKYRWAKILIGLVGIVSLRIVIGYVYTYGYDTGWLKGFQKWARIEAQVYDDGFYDGLEECSRIKDGMYESDYLHDLLTVIEN